MNLSLIHLIVKISQKVSENGGSVVDKEDREEEGQAVQEAPERPQDLCQGISFVKHSY